MEQWAAAHSLQDALATSAEVLLPALAVDEAQKNSLRYALSGLPIRDIGSREGASRYLAARARGVLEEAVPLAVVAFLADEAESIRLGALEEASRPESHEDPALAVLWTRLLQLRHGIRARATPRSRAARASGTWSFLAEPCAVSWKERWRRVRSGPSYGSFAAESRLSFPNDGEP
ncbi:MAG TPA: hypothetical protein VEU33_38205, partial [Archangium sp.]|nr:hypothetical protein [Archangium sp.]